MIRMKNRKVLSWVIVWAMLAAMLLSGISPVVHAEDPVLTNLALNKPVTASSEVQGYPASNAVDGISNSNASRWISEPNIFPQTLDIELGDASTISRAIIYGQYMLGSNRAGAQSDMRLQYWDGTSWVDIQGASCSGNTNSVVTWNFTPIVTEKVRLVIEQGTSTEAKLFEVEIFGYVEGAPAPSPTPSPTPILLPEPPPQYEWTALTPSADSRMIYVSSSEGNDANNGLSADTPVKTIAKARTMVREGYPDWILLKRGDVWQNETLYRYISGRSPYEQAVVTYYGDTGDRPLIKVNSNFIDHDGQTKNYQAFVGLEIVNYRMDPDDPGYSGSQHDYQMRFIGGGDSILVEDCVLRYYSIGIQSYNGKYTNMKIRRNIIVDSYSHGSTTDRNARVSGIYVSGVDGLIIEENVIDHNGWSEHPALNNTSLANMYNHNVYCQTDNVGNKVVYRGNIITRGSSHGIHGRPGGLYENNLFVQNSIGLQLGYDGTPLQSGTFAIARNNVILEGKHMQPGASGDPVSQAVWGLNIDDMGQGTFIVDNNIVANRKTGGANMGIDSMPGVNYINDNIQYNWGGGIGDMNDPSWLDPTRSVGSYHGTLGKEPTLEAFLNEARSRGVHEWPVEYTAYSVNDYIREGFNKNAVGQPAYVEPPQGPTPDPNATPSPTPTPQATPDPNATPVPKFGFTADFISSGSISEGLTVIDGAFTGKLIAQFELTTLAANQDSIVAFCDASDSPDAAEDFPIALRISPAGVLEALNGSSYQADRTINYAIDKWFYAEMVIDLNEGKYDVFITPKDGGVRQQLADDYSFRTGSAIDDLGKVCTFSNGAPGNFTANNFAVIPAEPAEGQWYSSAQDKNKGVHYLSADYRGKVTAEFDLIPLGSIMGGGIGYFDSATDATGWSSMNIIVTFQKGGYYTARNAGAYEFVNLINYAPGVRNHIKIEADLDAKTYDVLVDGVVLADDYAFRPDAPPIDDLGQVWLYSQANLVNTNNNFIVENHTVTVHDTGSTPTPTPSPTPTPIPGPSADFMFTGDFISEDNIADGLKSLGDDITSKIIVQFDLQALAQSQNSIIGFCDSSATPATVDDFPIAFKLSDTPTPLGSLMALDGSVFKTDNASVNYDTDNWFFVKMVIDMDAKTYDVFVTEHKLKPAKQIANDYAFRPGITIDDLGKVCFYSTKNSTPQDGLFTANNFAVIPYTPKAGQWYASALDPAAATFDLGSSNTGKVTMEFDMIPLGSVMEGGLGYFDSSTVATGYGQMNIIITFQKGGYYTARNAGNYECANTIQYAPGVKNHFKVDVDLDAKTYDVLVDGVVLADDYAFRPDAPPIDDVGKVWLYSQSNGTATDNAFIVENHVIYQSGASTPTPTPTPSTNVLNNGSLQLAYAVLSNSNVSLGGSSTITGDTAANGGKVKLTGSARISGKLSIGEGASYSLSGSSKINGEVVDLIPEPILNRPEFSQLPSDLAQRGDLTVGSRPTQSVTINLDGWYNKLSLVSNGALTIDVGDGIRRIRVTDLNISQGQINLTGSGTLYLYTDQVFSMGGSSTINASGSAEKLKIFVNGGGTVALSGDSKLTGSLYGPLASLSIAGNSKLAGNVILGGSKVTLSGNSSLTGVVYMPGATVDLSGSAGITGAVAANQLNGSGNIQVKFVESLCTIPSEFLASSIP